MAELDDFLARVRAAEKSEAEKLVDERVNRLIVYRMSDMLSAANNLLRNGFPQLSRVAYIVSATKILDEVNSIDAITRELFEPEVSAPILEKTTRIRTILDPHGSSGASSDS
jgi:hypothetical protein